MAEHTFWDNGIPYTMREQNDGQGDWVQVITTMGGDEGGSLPEGAATEDKQDDAIALLTELLPLLPASLGQKAAAASLAVVLASNQPAIPVTATAAASEVHMGEVGGRIPAMLTGTFTRPNNTTPYTAGDWVNDSVSAPTLLTIANCVRVNGGSGYIVGASLLTSKKSITPRWRIHVFNTATLTSGAIVNDNAPMVGKLADYDKRVNKFEMPSMTTPADATNSDYSESWNYELRVPVVAAAGSTSLHFAFEPLDGFTPDAQETFRLVLLMDQN